MAEVIQSESPLELRQRMCRGELPAAWQERLGQADPSLVLITVWAGRLSRVVAARYVELLSEHDLQYSDFATLTLLCLMGPTSPSSMQDHLVITSGGMTKTIDRLVARGLAERLPDPEDGRGVVVHVTRRGERLQTELFAADLERQEADLATMTRAEREELARSLRRFLDLVERS